MKKVVMATLILLTLVILPAVSAETEISVKTLPYYKVHIFVLENSETYNVLEKFSEEADAYGRVNVVADVNQPTVDLSVSVQWNGNEEAKEVLEDVLTNNGTIEIILPDHAEEIPDADKGEPIAKNNETNVTEQNPEELEAPEEEVTTNEEDPSKEPTTTGNTVLGNEDEKNSTSKVPWFIGIGLIVVIVALFVMKSMFKAGPETLALSKSVDAEEKMTSSEIEKAEKRIKEAQTEINKIKNQSKIKEAQKKIEEDRQKLEKLKRGEDEEEN